jgi:hypothetical protein
MNLTDAYMTVAFLKRLLTPFDKWSAHSLGLIDGDGNLLKKRADMTDAERSAFGTFDLLVLKIKRTLEKIPGGLGKAATLAAALKMVSEDAAVDVIDRVLAEDAPTNSAGSGQVAGMGVPPDSLPGRRRKMGAQLAMLKRRRERERD